MSQSVDADLASSGTQAIELCIVDVIVAFGNEVPRGAHASAFLNLAQGVDLVISRDSFDVVRERDRPFEWCRPRPDPRNRLASYLLDEPEHHRFEVM